MHKINPQTHSPQQNKKVVLTTAAIFKVSTPKGRRDNNCSSFTFVYQKECSRFKTKKVNIIIEFCILKLVQVPNFNLN